MKMILGDFMQLLFSHLINIELSFFLFHVGIVPGQVGTNIQKIPLFMNSTCLSVGWLLRDTSSELCICPAISAYIFISMDYVDYAKLAQSGKLINTCCKELFK